MALDLSRVASKALEAALAAEEDGDHRRPSRLGGMRGVAAGAALAVAARMAVAKRPALTDLGSIGDLAESLRERVEDRLADLGLIDDAAFADDDEEPEDEEELDDEEEPEDEEELDDDEEPEDEQAPDDGEELDEEEPDDEEPGPEDEEDLDDEDDLEDGEEPEDEGEEDERNAPPVLARGNGRGARRVDPAARPPKPPHGGRARSGSRQGKARK